MEESKPFDHTTAPTTSSSAYSQQQQQQQNDRLNCPSHNRKRWAIDKTVFDWHRWLPLHDRPKLRWALAILLAVIIIAVMVVGIVFTAEYYATYYASGAWVWNYAKDVRSNTSSSVAKLNTATTNVVVSGKEDSSFTPASMDDFPLNWGPQDEDEEGNPGIRETTPCDPRYSCAQHDQPSTDFDLSNSGIYCCNNETTCPKDGQLHHQTTCPQHLLQCSMAEGGGCCPDGTICDPAGCLIWNEHAPPPGPTATAVGGEPSRTVDVPHVIATAYKIGEIPSRAANQGKVLGYTSMPLLESLVLSLAVVWAWGMVVWG